MNLMMIIKLQNLILSLMAYEKLIHLTFIYKVVTWHRVHASLLWYFSNSFSFFFINCFIASLSLFWYLSHTLSLCTSPKRLLSLSIYISCSISLLLSVSLLFCYCFSISRSLTYFQSLWRNLWLYFTLSLRHYSSPSFIPVMIWLS